jgi:drug/metabolite transporter (DMT)-like permease
VWCWIRRFLFLDPKSKRLKVKRDVKMFPIIINIIFAVAAAIGTVALGLAFRDLGAMKFSLPFFWSLITNKWFIISVVLGFGSVFLRFAILKAQGVAQSSYYLQTSLIAVYILAYFVLGEQFTLKAGIGAILILGGAFLIGVR